MYVCVYACAHARAHARARTHARTHTHTHTHRLRGFLVGSLQHYHKIHQAMQELKENPQSSQDDDVDAGASL